MSIKDQLILEKLPRHVAVIMEGNGRWAKQQGHERIFGHQNGVRAVRDTAEAAAELGIEYLTLYAFSTENWNRPRAEVDALMELLVQTIHSEKETLNKNNIRLLTIGDTASLPARCREQLLEAITDTSKNTRLSLVLALSYSSRWEITNALKQIAIELKNDRLAINQIDETVISNHLTTNSIPEELLESIYNEVGRHVEEGRYDWGSSQCAIKRIDDFSAHAGRIIGPGHRLQNCDAHLH